MIAVDRVANRRELARGQGAEIVNFEDDDPVELVGEMTRVTLIGVYPQTVESVPIVAATMKNLTLTMGNCNHRRYIPRPGELTRAGAVGPSAA